MPHQLTCQQCGAGFTARAGARYCSGACRVAAHRGTPPTSTPRSQPEPEVEPEAPLHPDRRAWLSIDGRRCWVRLNFEPPSLDLANPLASAHREGGQFWVGNVWPQVEDLRHGLARHYGAKVIDLPAGIGPLPPVLILELWSSPDPLHQAMVHLLLVTPPDRRRKLVRQVGAAVHPDGARGRPPAADHLLATCYALLEDDEALTGWW